MTEYYFKPDPTYLGSYIDTINTRFSRDEITLIKEDEEGNLYLFKNTNTLVGVIIKLDDTQAMNIAIEGHRATEVQVADYQKQRDLITERVRINNLIIQKTNDMLQKQEQYWINKKNETK